MPIEEILNEFRKELIAVTEHTEKMKCLYRQLSENDKEHFDWITVRKAAGILDCSLWTIYEMIKTNKIECKKINKKSYVRLSEIKEIK